MSVDPKGVQPGLAPQARPQETVHHLKCRNPKCTSMTATEIRIVRSNTKNGGQRIYRCTECSHSWGINTGGSFNLP